MAAASDIYVAAKTAVFEHDGTRVRIVGGQTTVRAGHPLLDGREELFRPLTVDYDTDGDTSTAGSGSGESYECGECDTYIRVEWDSWGVMG